MPTELAELPGVVTIRKPPFRFTRENAREMSLRANAARWSRERAKPQPQPDPEPILGTDSQDPVLELIEEEIKATRAALKAKLEPHHRAALLRALCDLLDRRRIARGEPLPGSLRPTPDRERRQARATGPAYLSTPTPSVPPTT